MSEPAVDFWLSGPLRIRRDGEVETLGPKRGHEILALLLLRANSAVSVSHIARCVWPAPGQEGEKSVPPYISRIRALLAGLDCALTARQGSYILEIDPMRVDVLRFNQLLDRAERADHGERRRLVEEALELCPTDALLTGFTRHWAHEAREEHRERWRAAALRRNRYWLDDGEYDRLLSVLRREGAHQSTDQRIAEDYVLALYHSGQMQQALQHHERIVQRLTARGTAVQNRFRRLGEAIRRQDPKLDHGRAPTTHGVPDMLPPPTIRLEGRHAEIRAMEGHAAARDAVQVIGIYGAPGIGKTSLAVAFAHRNKDRYPGGVLVAELGSGDAAGAAIDGALESFLRELGVSGDAIPAERAARLARYRELTRNRAMLVLLDNVDSSEDAATLLPTGRGSLVIVTSQKRLTALTIRHSAVPLVLGPIDHSASVALLTRLAGGRPDWSPAVAADIARSCGGHPLALCLAGAGLATRPEEPAAALAAALAEPGRRIEVLDRYAEADEAVAEVIGWSYRGLEEPAARVFRLLGLSPGPALDLRALARLTDLSEEDLRPVIEGLVAAHLVTTVGGDRYGMLDLIAEYASAVAMETDDDEVRAAALDRLYGHYRDAAQGAAHTMWPQEVNAAPAGYDFADPSAARAWLDAHRDDLIAVARHPAASSRPGHVVDLANSLFRYLDHGGYLDQAAALQEAALAAARRMGDDAAAARALGRWGAILFRRGQFDRADAALAEAYTLSARIGDSQGQVLATGNRGRVAFRRGAYPEAIAHHAAAAGLARDSNDRLGEARALTNLGIVYKACGELAEALRHLNAAQAICEKVDAPDLAPRVAATIAGVFHAQGRLDEADQRYQEAIDIFKSLGDRVGEATALSYLGLVRTDQGRYREAAALHEEALQIFTEVGDESGSIDTLLNLGRAMVAMRRHTAAVRYHTEALTRATAVGDKGQIARAYVCLAEDHVALADQTGADVDRELKLAREHLDEALSRYRDLGVDPPPPVATLSARLAI